MKPSLQSTLDRLNEPGVREQMFGRGYMVPMLPLLEHNHEVARSALERLISDSPGVSPISASALLRDLALCGLRSGCDYWAELAVNWLETGLPLDTALRDAADSLPATTAQHIRHRAFRTVRRWERSHHE